MDLHLLVDGRRKVASLEEALRDAIAAGRLAAGTRLPPSRTLATDLGIARNSVAEVYARLVAEGRLEARVGAGTWVADRPSAGPATTAPVHRSTRFDLDLRGGLPDGSAFPRTAWARATARALSGASAAALGYSTPEGAAALRVALADYLARARGVVASADDVVVTHGFGELLALAARAVAARGGRRIAVEGYGHVSHRDLLVASGLEPVPLPVDDDGAVVEGLAGASVDAVLLTPAHQFPIGVPLSGARRAAVARWAEQTGGLVVEDDYDGEFRYDRRAIGAMQALAPGHVVYGGTASKSLSPALGLGWGVVPPAWRDDLLAQRRRSGAATDAIAQLALAALIESGDYDRTVRTLRLRYRARRERFEELMTEGAPGSRVVGLAAGIHCLLELPDGVAEHDVSEAAATRGLRVDGLGAYAATPDLVDARPAAMVVGYGAPPAHRFEEALAVVVEAIRVAARRAPGRSSA
ncbi:PLP-dependent aminotransferase family protein [Agromyces sp. MMS24-K17]|uniref:MocR-like pyridoxine biosynthesis transcription factor PdxR n=1 Tax=Agromyces sp. MMS24-K17 TaxID=3372850 RepID=UPI00375423A4